MTAPTVLDGEDAVRSAVGSELGTSEWFEVTAGRIADYVAATGDPPIVDEVATQALRARLSTTRPRLPNVAWHPAEAAE